MYATAVYAVLDMNRRTIRMSSAGHPLPLLARRDGDVITPVLDTSLCLLWEELREIPCVELELRPGDRWLFFTDGITDRLAPDGTMFDLERLAAALARSRASAPPDIVSGIISDLSAFSGAQEPEDDQTLLVVGFDAPK